MFMFWYPYHTRILLGLAFFFVINFSLMVARNDSGVSVIDGRSRTPGASSDLLPPYDGRHDYARNLLLFELSRLNNNNLIPLIDSIFNFTDPCTLQSIGVFWVVFLYETTFRHVMNPAETVSRKYNKPRKAVFRSWLNFGHQLNPAHLGKKTFPLK